MVHNIEVGAAVIAHGLRFFQGYFPPRTEGLGAVDASAFGCGLAGVAPVDSSVDEFGSLGNRSGVLT